MINEWSVVGLRRVPQSVTSGGMPTLADCSFELLWCLGLPRHFMDDTDVVDICCMLYVYYSQLRGLFGYRSIYDMLLSSKVDPSRSEDPSFGPDAHKVLVLERIKVARQPHVIHYSKCFCFMTRHACPSNITGSYQTQIFSVSLHTPTQRNHSAHMDDLILLKRWRESGQSDVNEEEGITHTGHWQEPAGHWQEEPQLHPWSSIVMVSLERKKVKYDG